MLNNGTQTLTTASGLDPGEKAQLDTLVQSLKADLEKLKATHEDEVQEITLTLEKAIARASKPAKERNSRHLQLSAKGLEGPAKLVSKVAPRVLKTAGLVAKFITGLGTGTT